MSVTRGMACAIAVAAAIDPAVRVGRPEPVPVALRASSGSLFADRGIRDDDGAVAAARDRLEAAMPGALAINTADEPRAVIVSGPLLDASAMPPSGPVSFVLPETDQGPRVRLVSVTNPRPILPGWSAVVTAEIQGRDVAPGSTSAVVLESQGIEIDRAEHKWNHEEERATVRLAFAPPAAGSFALTVRVLPPEGRLEPAVHSMPVRVVAESRRLRILAFDPRPSWGSGFVRRALEEDPDFEMAARVRASRGLEVRTGSVPIALSGETLDPFDVVMVGAPEELTAAETAALDSFARRRGGTVVFIADRKPSGPYVRLTGADAFEEALVEKPVRLNTGEGPGIRASEFVYPRTLPLGSEAMATIPHGTGSRAPLISMPLGAGRIVFSGLLDAWRYRGDDGDAFGAFWRSQIGREAIRAPRRLEVTVHPELVAPGHPVRIRAAIRGTDLEASGSLVAVPWITAKSVDDRGSQQFVRLWPTAEPGVFEGKLIAPRTGRYDVRVETGAGTSADVPVVVSDAGSPKTVDTNLVMPGAIARATGGVVVSQSNIDPLVIHLRGLQRGEVAAVRHPMGSPLWAVAFVALLSAEWFARRRRGLR